jgi:hypothetical protein
MSTARKFPTPTQVCGFRATSTEDFKSAGFATINHSSSDEVALLEWNVRHYSPLERKPMSGTLLDNRYTFFEEAS